MGAGAARVFAVALAVFGAGEAAAEPIHVEWQAPDGCPDAAHVHARVEQLLGGAPGADRKPLSATGTINPTGDQLELVLELRGEDRRSTRKLRSVSCKSLSEAGALVIALAFDPDAVHATALAPPPTPAPPTPPAPIPAPVPVSPPPSPAPLPAPIIPPSVLEPDRSAQPPSTGPKLGVGISAAFDGDLGSLPAFAPGARVGIAIDIDLYRVEPLFVIWPSSEATLADRPTTGAKFSLLAGILRGCRRVLPWFSRQTSIVTLTGCVGMEIGRMTGEGFGVDKPSEGAALWIAPTTDAELRLALPGPIGLLAGLGLAVPLDPRSFVIQTPDRSVVHEPAPVSGRFVGGIDARF